MTTIDRLSALADAATPAPWSWYDQREPEEPGELPYVPQCSHIGGTLIGMDDTYERSDADAALIAAMRNALPAILVALRAGQNVCDVNGAKWSEPCDVGDAITELRVALIELEKLAP